MWYESIEIKAALVAVAAGALFETGRGAVKWMYLKRQAHLTVAKMLSRSVKLIEESDLEKNQQHHGKALEFRRLWRDLNTYAEERRALVFEYANESDKLKFISLIRIMADGATGFSTESHMSAGALTFVIGALSKRELERLQADMSSRWVSCLIKWIRK